MEERGFRAVLFDGLRTRAEAARNAARGKGIADSIHCYGAAADLICAQHGWGCFKAKCKFFEVLVEEARALKLVAGIKLRNGNVDWPHVQGIPATKKDQDAMRRLGTGEESIKARDALVRAFLAR